MKMSAKTRLIHFKQEKYNTETSAGEIGSAGRGRNVMRGGVVFISDIYPRIAPQCHMPGHWATLPALGVTNPTFE